MAAQDELHGVLDLLNPQQRAAATHDDERGSRWSGSSEPEIVIAFSPHLKMAAPAN